MKTLLIVSSCLTVLTACSTKSKQTEGNRPNILIIYADDLGFGDIGINGAKGVQTPNIDRMANNGINFTDAHCSAATSTPSRYSLLTGSYAFRKNAEVLPGDAPLLIDPRQGTMASMLKKAGYKTGVIGKWHLGLGTGKLNWNEEIKPGPREIGFDYSYLIPATGDRVPCVFVENQRVVGFDPSDPITVNYNERIEGYPVGSENLGLLKQMADPQHSNSIINGVSRIGFMSGGKKALWIDEDFPIILTNKAKDFINENKSRPFFLYFAMHDIHVPRITNPNFVGISKMGPRGDAIAQVDWCTGQLVKHLEYLGIAENTLIIFSSDNGPILDDGYADQAIELLNGHKPSGIYRGAKYSIFEAGTRMPTIVYWPGTVKPGISNALVSQVDLYASFAKLVGQDIAPGDAPDSEEHLDAWLGRKDQGREILLEEAFTFALRIGDWKYIKPRTGGNPIWFNDKKVEGGMSQEDQLYNLKDDVTEKVNVANENPEIVSKLKNRLEAILSDN